MKNANKRVCKCIPGYKYARGDEDNVKAPDRGALRNHPLPGAQFAAISPPPHQGLTLMITGARTATATKHMHTNKQQFHFRVFL